MLGYFVRRCLQAIPVVLLVSIVVFAVLRAVPGDPAVQLAGPDATPEVVAAVRQQLGLRGSYPAQYAHWLGNVLHGDFGTSYRSRRSVGSLIKSALPVTVQLTLISTTLAVLIGVTLGTAAGVSRGGLWDYVLALFSTATLGLPDFLIAIFGIYLFAVKFGWLPAGGYISLPHDPGGWLQRFILPALALALPSAAVFARFARSAVEGVMRQDYIRTARAKGLSERMIVSRHALRTSLIPLITIVGLQIGRLLGGAVIIEQVFAWPGMGRLMLNAIEGQDYLVVQGGLIVLVTGFVLVNLLTDLVYGLGDPRIRLG